MLVLEVGVELKRSREEGRGNWRREVDHGVKSGAAAFARIVPALKSFNEGEVFGTSCSPPCDEVEALDESYL
jgi:hypothetical protein